MDKIAEDFIRSNGALPGFLGYQGFPNTLCVSVNDQVVHGIPSNYALKDGDITMERIISQAEKDAAQRMSVYKAVGELMR